jgi:hypothetical protein
MSGAEAIIPIVFASCSGVAAADLLDRFGNCLGCTKQLKASPNRYRTAVGFRETDRRLTRLLDEDSPMTKREAFECGVLAGGMGSSWREYSRLPGNRTQD